MKLWRKHDPAVGRVSPEERGADRLGEAEADRAADERAEQVGDLRLAQAGLDQNDNHAEQHADGRPLTGASGWNGRSSAAAQATAATNSARVTMLPGHGGSGYEKTIIPYGVRLLARYPDRYRGHPSCGSPGSTFSAFW